MGLELTDSSEVNPSAGGSERRTVAMNEEKQIQQRGNVTIVKRQDRQDVRSPQQRQQYLRPDLTPLTELTAVGINTAKDFASALNIRIKRFKSGLPADYQLTLEDHLSNIEAIVRGQNYDYGVIDADYLFSFLKSYRIKNVEGMEDLLDSFGTEFFELDQEDETKDLSNGFFIRWSRDRPMIDLMEKWLTSNVDNLKRWKRFKECSEEDLANLAESMVVTPCAASKTTLGNVYVRAYVMKPKVLNKKKGVEVMSLDRGQTYFVPMERIYIFNHDLLTRRKLRTYSFFVEPERIKYPTEYQGKGRWRILTKAFRSFRDKYPARIKCRILNISKDTKEVTVKLTGFRISSSGNEVTEEFHVFFSNYLLKTIQDDIGKAMLVHHMPGELTGTIEEGKMNIEKLESYGVQLIGISKDAEHMYVFHDPMLSINSKLEKLQHDYNERYSKLKHVDPKPGRACVWCDPDEIWHRVVVLQVFHSDALVNVWLVDWGETRAVPIENLRHLHKMHAFPASVLKVRLAHVEIKNYFAVKDFLIRFKDAILSCTPIDVAGNAEPGPCGQIEYPSRSYGAIFRIQEGPPSTIQEELWKAGLALPNGPVISNFMKKSKVVYYNSSMLDAELKTTCDTVIQFTPFKAVNPLDSSRMRDGEKVSLNASDFPPSIEECMSHVFIGFAGTGPMDFYVQSVLNVYELNQMEDDLLKVKMQSKALKDIDDAEKLMAGVLVIIEACNPDQKRACKRMMIICKSAGLESCFDGLLIDHGETKFGVPVQSMKWPPECIKTVPPMCQRVHLEMPPGYRPACLNGFDYRCCEFWKTFIRFWQEHESAYWIWTRKEEHTVVFLDEFQQQLAYDVEEDDWVPGPLVKRNWQEQLNELWLQSEYQHPILSHFYTSVGVLVAYHVFDEKAVQFLDMMDFLVKRKFVVKHK